MDGVLKQRREAQGRFSEAIRLAKPESSLVQ
jgi:hypothetical protein